MYARATKTTSVNRRGDGRCRPSGALIFRRGSERREVLRELLAVLVVRDWHLARELLVRLRLGKRTRGLVPARHRLVRVREIPVAETVLLADVETAPRVTQRCLVQLDDGVHARHLPLTAGEVLRLCFRSLAPVIPRSVRRVNHAVVVLAGADQPPHLVEEVDAELPVVRRQAVRASAGVQLERPRFSRYCWW